MFHLLLFIKAKIIKSPGPDGWPPVALRETTIEITEGSVLGPLLFMTYIPEVVQSIK